MGFYDTQDLMQVNFNETLSQCVGIYWVFEGISCLEEQKNMFTWIISLTVSPPVSVEGSKLVTMTKLAKNILEKDGFFGLYRGILLNFMKVIPATWCMNIRVG